MPKCLIKLFWKMVDRMDTKRISGQTAPQGVKVVEDIAYISGGNPMHTLDVYYSENINAKQPVLFNIHGGGWVYGHKGLNKYFCMNFALLGFTVININYRLTTEEPFPACIYDIFAALEWLKREGDKYYADIDKVCVAGDSAGAHLALVSAIITKTTSLQEEMGISPSLDIKALGLICGAQDLGRYIKKRIFRGYQKMVFGEDYKNNKYRDVSIPYNYFSKDLPPIYAVSSNKDFAKASTLSLIPLLKKYGIKNKVRYITDKTVNKLTHVFNVIQPEWPESREVNLEMSEFFKENI